MKRTLATLAVMVAFTLGATPMPNEALGRWLPNVAPNFVPWGQAKARYAGRFDSFACGTGPAQTNVTREFDYAIGTCRILQKGTTLLFGSGEPQRGRVLYDSAHRIALYYVGCCAGRTYALAAGVGPSAHADLAPVTQRAPQVQAGVCAAYQVFAHVSAVFHLRDLILPNVRMRIDEVLRDIG